MKPWSKLQSALYNLIANDVDFQIHCSTYPMHSQYGNTSVPRYWITIGRKIVWDYPRNFPDQKQEAVQFPYVTEISAISCLIRDYIDTPLNQLMLVKFENDNWYLTQILKACDRRLGKKQLVKLAEETEIPVVKDIIEIRLNI